MLRTAAPQNVRLPCLAAYKSVPRLQERELQYLWSTSQTSDVPHVKGGERSRRLLRAVGGTRTLRTYREEDGSPPPCGAGGQPVCKGEQLAGVIFDHWWSEPAAPPPPWGGSVRYLAQPLPWHA